MSMCISSMCNASPQLTLAHARVAQTDVCSLRSQILGLHILRVRSSKAIKSSGCIQNVIDKFKRLGFAAVPPSTSTDVLQADIFPSTSRRQVSRPAVTAFLDRRRRRGRTPRRLPLTTTHAIERGPPFGWTLSGAAAWRCAGCLRQLQFSTAQLRKATIRARNSVSRAFGIHLQSR